MENFHIIQALCRSALANNPTGAVKHQIKRLEGTLRSQGHNSMADCISGLLEPASNEENDFRIIQSDGVTKWATKQERYNTGHIQSDLVGDFFANIHLGYKGDLRFIEVQHFQNSDTRLSCLVVDNKMVASVIERRDDLNFEEFTFSHKPL